MYYVCAVLANRFGRLFLRFARTSPRRPGKEPPRARSQEVGPRNRTWFLSRKRVSNRCRCSGVLRRWPCASFDEVMPPSWQNPARQTRRGHSAAYECSSCIRDKWTQLIKQLRSLKSRWSMPFGLHNISANARVFSSRLAAVPASTICDRESAG